jgi:hypothetical protein
MTQLERWWLNQECGDSVREVREDKLIGGGSVRDVVAKVKNVLGTRGASLVRDVVAKVKGRFG